MVLDSNNFNCWKSLGILKKSTHICHIVSKSLFFYLLRSEFSFSKRQRFFKEFLDNKKYINTLEVFPVNKLVRIDNVIILQKLTIVVFFLLSMGRKREGRSKLLYIPRSNNSFFFTLICI